MNKFSYHSSQYTDFRPQYPKLLFEYLKKIIGDGIVLDCGCGSGQSTQGISQYFKNVIASDLSFDLLLKANKLSNVSYVQSKAEQLSIRTNSIDLICIAQAIHWFSLTDFYKEVNRILKSNGVIAAWGYNQAIIESSVDQIINKVYLKIKSFQNPSRERQYLYDHYQTLPFPFKRLTMPNFNLEVHWNLPQWLGYMNTWPSILEYQKKFNVNLVLEIEDELSFAWGNPLASKLITWPIFMLLGKK